MSGHELQFQHDESGCFWARMESVEDIGQYFLVTSARVGNEYQVQDANSSDAGKRPCWGMALDRMNNGWGRVAFFGPVTNSNWNWTRGAILYLAGTDGQITESAPGYEQEIGWALTPTTIIFSPKCVYVAI